MKQTDFAKTLARYLTDFLPGQRNVSPNTIKSYRDTFKQYLMFMQDEQRIRPERISFASITTLSIKDFLQWLETSKNVSISTRNQRLAAIHSFLDMLRLKIQKSCLRVKRSLASRLRRSSNRRYLIYLWISWLIYSNSQIHPRKEDVAIWP